MYHFDGPVEGWVAANVKKFYDLWIFPLLDTETQQIVLVPGSFGSDVNHFPLPPQGNGSYVCDRACYETMNVLDAEDYYEWALADDRVAAVFPWNWGGCPTCNGSKWTPEHTCCMDEYGTRDLPTLRSTWLDLGRKLSQKVDADNEDATTTTLSMPSKDRPFLAKQPPDPKPPTLRKPPPTVTVFRGNDPALPEWPCIRIPAAVAVPDTDVVVAFAECRTWIGDGCDIDGRPSSPGSQYFNRTICSRRSTDGGATWGGTKPKRVIGDQY
jgi:hypothetical protein